MTIHVNVGTIDPRVTRVIIYKAKTAHISLSALPTPWKTLTPAEITGPIADDDYPSNSYVAYRVGLEYGGAVNVGEEVIIGTWAETGFGPQELLRGNMAWGYFGKIDASTFVTATNIQALIGGEVQPQELWLKCAYEGRVIYIPNRNNTRITPSALHNAGAMYGMETKGPDLYTVLNNVPQTKRAQFMGKSYRLRLPRVDDYPVNYRYGSPENSESGMLLATMGASGTQRNTGNAYSSNRMICLDGVSRDFATSQLASSQSPIVIVPAAGGTTSSPWGTAYYMSVLLEYAPGV